MWNTRYDAIIGIIVTCDSNVLYVGNGKSYYILNKLNDTCSAYRIIPINEGFTRHQVIKSLCSLPVYPDAFNSETKVYGICFNFTMYLTEVRSTKSFN